MNYYLILNLVLNGFSKENLEQMDQLTNLERG